MIRAVVSAHVNAPADRVRELYREQNNWAKLFPETIRRARVVRREPNTTVVEVDHIEGKVTNILDLVSPARMDLTELSDAILRPSQTNSFRLGRACTTGSPG